MRMISMLHIISGRQPTHRTLYFRFIKIYRIIKKLYAEGDSAGIMDVLYKYKNDQAMSAK